MRATQGALIVASTLQIVLGFSGLWRNVARLVSGLSGCVITFLVFICGLNMSKVDCKQDL